MACLCTCLPSLNMSKSEEVADGAWGLAKKALLVAEVRPNLGNLGFSDFSEPMLLLQEVRWRMAKVFQAQ